MSDDSREDPGRGAVQKEGLSDMLAVFDGLDEPVYIADMDSHEVLFVNKAIVQVIGEPDGLPCYRYLQGRSSPCPFCTNDKLRGERAGQSIIWEFHNERTRRWYRCVDRAISWPGRGRVRLEIAIDITERRRADSALRESEEKYRSLFEQSVEAIYVHDLEGRILDVNQMACEQSGYSKAELAAMTVFDFLASPVDPEQIKGIWKTWDLGQHSIYEGEHRRKNGEVYPVQISSGLVRYEGRHLLLAIVLDIGERLRAEREKARLEEQLAQAQKMEAVGRLAGGVAHDFNNMLGAILGAAELGLDRLPVGDPLRGNLEEIRSAAERSAALTGQLLAFARRQPIVPQILDLNERVESTLQILRRVIGEDIDLVWAPGADLWKVRMDPSQLDQILANLCVNARDAIEGVGKVTIETVNIVLDEAYCAANAGFRPGSYVILSVSDNGCGMERSLLDKLFEPFFTTKSPGKGTGLGLAAIHGIVKQNGGFINVYSEPGRGTTFKVYLQRCEAVLGQPEKIRVAKEMQTGQETILLVEDEPSLLRVGQLQLESLGYAVLVASGPREALRLAAEHEDSIDLLMTDVVMPEMNGRDLAEQMTALYPRLKVLFTSGYTANVIAHHGVLDEGVQFIQKPYLKQTLAEKLRAVLDT